MTVDRKRKSDRGTLVTEQYVPEHLCGARGRDVRRGRELYRGLVLILLSVLMWPPIVHAQLQSTVQQKCINTLNADGALVAKIQAKVNRKCLKDASKGELLGTAEQCLATQTGGKLAQGFNKALTKTQTDAALCAQLPSIAFAGPNVVIAAAHHREDALMDDLFGTDLDSAVAACDADKLKCKCQGAVLAKVEAIAAAGGGLFQKCKKRVLKTATSAADVARCLYDPSTDGSVAAATAFGGKLDKLRAKLDATVTKSCDTPGVTSGAFPGKCAALSGTSLTLCLTRQVKCRLCRSLNDMDNLSGGSGGGVSCDAFDDGVNLSCDETSIIDSDGSQFLYSSIAVPADGLPIISYYDFLNGSLKVTKCGDPACATLAATNTVDTLGDTGHYSSIAVPADGLPVISYQDSSSGTLKVAKCSDASCNAAVIATVDGGVDYVGQFTSLAVPADGLPIISYYDGTNGDLKVAKCADAACTSASSIVVLDPLPFGIGSTTSIAVPADNLPVIVWGGSQLNVAKCGNAECSAGNVVTPVTSSPNWSSLFIPSDGKPVIAHQDGGGGLGVVKCGDAACTSGNQITQVDGTALGPNPSIFVPADGLPVIAYQNYFSPNTLHVAKCADDACTSPATITVVDAIAPTGYYPSLFVPADGLPVISYTHGSVPNVLKVLKCANGSCS